MAKRLPTTVEIVHGEQILLRLGTLVSFEAVNGFIGFPVNAIGLGAMIIGAELTVRFMGMIWGRSVSRSRLAVAEKHGEEMLKRKRANG